MSDFSNFLDALRERTSITELVGRKVSWDARKSQPSKGDMWAPCPFHSEKTASFHVDERKGFYYCFGCHAKGNIFSFLEQSENITFIEAVKRLAEEAGMTLPTRDPRAEEKRDEQAALYEIMEAANTYFRMQLKRTIGAGARAYLEGRGLKDATIERFEIGFAPNGKAELFDHLRAKGFREEAIIEVGLAVKPDDGRALYDRFRARTIFPIRDGRGRLIAFGGRATNPDALAKYLNSPQTVLFNKSRALYNLSPAKAVKEGTEPLIICEGYMDVIGLTQAGFERCVAPLGTALNEGQLAFLWRLSPEPIFALDGDAAGLRAAYRLIEIALPLISSEKRLKFCLLPEGMDPDDIVRKQGKALMQSLLAQAVPLIELIWLRETEGKDFKTPEARAALEAKLDKLLSKIAPLGLRKHYQADIKNRLWTFFRAKSKAPFAPKRGQKRFPHTGAKDLSAPVSTTKNTLLANERVTDSQILEDTAIAILLKYPAFCEEFTDAFLAHEFSPMHSKIQQDILNFHGAPDGLFDAIAKKNAEAVEKLYKLNHISILPVIQHSDSEKAHTALEEIFAYLTYRRGLAEEIAESVEAFDGAKDEALTYRLREFEKNLQSALGGESGYDILGTAEEQKGLREYLAGWSAELEGAKKKR